MPVTTRGQNNRKVSRTQLAGSSADDADLKLSSVSGSVEYLQLKKNGINTVKHPVFVKCYRGKNGLCREAALASALNWNWKDVISFATDKHPVSKIVPSIHFSSGKSQEKVPLPVIVDKDKVRALMLDELEPYKYDQYEGDGDFKLTTFLKDGSVKINGDELWDIFEQVQSSLNVLKDHEWFYIDIKADNVLLAQQKSETGTKKLRVFLADIDSLATTSSNSTSEENMVEAKEDGSFKMAFTYVPKFICAHLNGSMGTADGKKKKQFNSLENVKALVDYWIPFLLVALVTIFILKTFCGDARADMSSGVSLYCPDETHEPEQETQMFFEHALNVIQKVLATEVSKDVCEDIAPKKNNQSDESFQSSFLDNGGDEWDEKENGEDEDEEDEDEEDEDEEVGCDLKSDLEKCWTIMPVLKQMGTYAYDKNDTKDKIFVERLKNYITNLNIYAHHKSQHLRPKEGS